MIQGLRDLLRLGATLAVLRNDRHSPLTTSCHSSACGAHTARHADSDRWPERPSQAARSQHLTSLSLHHVGNAALC